MIISSIAIAGALGAGTVGASVKVYREQKQKKKYPWTYALRRMDKNKLLPLHKRKAILAGGQRRHASVSRQKQEISSAPSAAEPNTEVEQEANRYLALSGMSLALSTAGIYYAPFTLMSAPLLLMILSPIVKRGYDLIVNERKVGMAIVDVLGIAGPVLSGHFVLASVFGLLYHTSRKLLIKTEDHSRKSLINVFSEQPRFIWLMRDGVEVQLPFEEEKKAIRLSWMRVRPSP